jgi:hypothetical protein
MCNLHAPTKRDKQSLSYLLQFLQLDSNGFHSPNVPRQWEKTIENTYNLFNTSLTINITEVKRLRLIYGVTDSINNKFIDGIRSKSKDVTKKAGELMRNDPTDMFNPFFKFQGTYYFIICCPIDLPGFLSAPLF